MVANIICKQNSVMTKNGKSADGKPKVKLSKNDKQQLPKVAAILKVSEQKRGWLNERGKMTAKNNQLYFSHYGMTFQESIG